MFRNRLLVAIGPVQIMKEDGVYVAYWQDDRMGRISQTIDKKWNRWLESNYSMDPLSGLGSVFLPPEVLKPHPLWKKKVDALLKGSLETL